MKFELTLLIYLFFFFAIGDLGGAEIAEQSNVWLRGLECHDFSPVIYLVRKHTNNVYLITFQAILNKPNLSLN